MKPCWRYHEDFRELQRVIVVLIDLLNQLLDHGGGKQGHVLCQDSVQLVFVDLLRETKSYR